jgi:hypothetical protein
MHNAAKTMVRNTLSTVHELPDLANQATALNWH